jgi:AzlC protein
LAYDPHGDRFTQRIVASHGRELQLFCTADLGELLTRPSGHRHNSFQLDVGDSSFDVLHGETGVHATDTRNRHDSAAQEDLICGEVGDARSSPVQIGLPWWVAPALSLSAFAGSLELLLVGMIATVEPLAAVAVTVFVVNFRHVFYMG